MSIVFGYEPLEGIAAAAGISVDQVWNSHRVFLNILTNNCSSASSASASYSYLLMFFPIPIITIQIQLSRGREKEN